MDLYDGCPIMFLMSKLLDHAIKIRVYVVDSFAAMCLLLKTSMSVDYNFHRL